MPCSFKRATDIPSGGQPDTPIKDAMSGQILDRSLVTVARTNELEYFLTNNVWLERPRMEARAKTGNPPIPVKWVDANKGDNSPPNYRSRLVARDIRLPGKSYLCADTSIRGIANSP